MIVCLDVFIQLINIEMNLLLKRFVKNCKPLGGLIFFDFI